jgi:DNA-binding transcriptional LysR family regulator
MDLHQLQYFVAVAEEGHFTHAAARVLVAQPAISQQIRRLENELGEPLFYRDHRTVRLTAAGRALLPHARATLAAAGRARAAVESLSGLLTGQLTVGAFEAAPGHLLTRSLGRFRREHPAVEVRVTEAYAGALLDAVRHGELDAAITAIPADRRVPAGLQVTDIATEPLMVATSPAHPLAARPQVTLAQLREEPMITLSAGSGLRAHLDNACRRAGFQPRITAETSHLALLWELVAEGIGSTIAPRSTAPGDGRVAFVPISRPRLDLRIILAWADPAPSPAGRAFLSIVRAQIGPQHEQAPRSAAHR